MIIENDPARRKIHSTESEEKKREMFYDLFKGSPIPSREMLPNLGVYLNRITLSRIMLMHELYLKILPVPGVIMEFGTRWGQNMALFSSFRGMYEPYNFSRKIVGFDTFSGFPSVSEKDGVHDVMAKGAYAVETEYEKYLDKVLAYHESESPLSHIKKYELIKGDAVETTKKYLKEHPETVVALAYFDFDLYEPTKKCLELIKERLVKGSVVVFDELNCPLFPGETIAVMEAIGLNNCALRHSPLNPWPAYMVIE